LFALIKRAAAIADIVEVRFDALEPRDVRPAVLSIAASEIDKPLIATFRAKEQGGFRDLGRDEREDFWNRLPDIFLADVEEDMLAASATIQKRIVSYHDMTGHPEDVGAIDARLSAAHTDATKIAVSTSDATDSIKLWNLLDQHNGFIPVGMGEAGIWTRILSLAHGAFLTYAGLDESGATAPGQLTAREMIELYRVKKLDLETKVYGVIGNPVSSSLSPVIHNAAFAASGINAVFIPLLVKDLDAFMSRMVLPATREVELNFCGFAVTMPHKQTIIKYLDGLDPVATAVGAVNTVALVGGKFMGYNTDVDGFIEPLARHFGDLHGARVAVLGAGGAARACIYGLKQSGAEVSVLARNESKAEALARELAVNGSSLSKIKNQNSKIPFDIVVNATPLGMKGQLSDQTPLTAEELGGVKFVFDLVTRPDDTPLIREANAAGVPTTGGQEMLIAQAIKQFEIWTGRSAAESVMKEAVLDRQTTSV
jgi:3-dehydroquinate dehydratase/shikimate dehydrogenase